jgi:hypothetical protein
MWIDAKVVQNLAPFSFSTLERWGNPWCGGWLHCRDTCSKEVWVCKTLCHDLGRDSVLCLFSCLVWIFGRKFSDVLPPEVFQKFSPNFLVARSHQNQCCVLVWGSFANFHCSVVLGLHRVLILLCAA